MKIFQDKLTAVITDVICDVCSSSTTHPSGSANFAVLSAHWGYGSSHDGQRYEIHLCENCFTETRLHLRRQRMVAHMFEDDDASEGTADSESFGLVECDNYFKS